MPRCLKSLKKSQLACKPAMVVSAGNQAAAAPASCCACKEGYGDRWAGMRGTTGPGMSRIASRISSQLRKPLGQTTSDLRFGFVGLAAFRTTQWLKCYRMSSCVDGGRGPALGAVLTR